MAWRLELKSCDMTESNNSLQERIGQLESTQDTFIKSNLVLSKMSLSKAIADSIATREEISHLRIYAISSQQILSFINSHPTRIKQCDLLIRGIPEGELNSLFRSQIITVISDWKRLQRQGKVDRLTIRLYDFFPTEYHCIIDQDFLILGLYDSTPDDYSGVGVRNPVLVTSISHQGTSLIEEYLMRFDNLFAVCETHHGDNTLYG